MELEEMKNLWQKYDKAMADNRVLNEKLITELMKNKSGSSLKKMMNAEYLGLVLCILLTFSFLTMAGRAFDSSLMMVSFILLMAALVWSIVGAIYKIRLLSAINLSGSAITDVAYKMQRFRLFLSKERLFGCILFPILIIATYVFIDGYTAERVVKALPALAIGSVAGIAMALAIYKSMYFDNIKEIMQNLEEVKSFRQEAA